MKLPQQTFQVETYFGITKGSALLASVAVFPRLLTPDEREELRRSVLRAGANAVRDFYTEHFQDDFPDPKAAREDANDKPHSPDCAGYGQILPLGACRHYGWKYNVIVNA